MGKVRDIVHRDIPRGPTIACSVASDFLLTAGVSNWGGYAVAVGLYLVSACPIHERYRRRAVGFSPSEEDLKRFKRALPNVNRVRVESIDSYKGAYLKRIMFQDIITYGRKSLPTKR